LAGLAPPEKPVKRSAREERVIAGFEDIQRFVEKHGRAPQHGEDRDIFERLCAVRLDRLRALHECRALLEPLDHQGLLAKVPRGAAPADDAIDIDRLAAELAGVAEAGDITVLRHVRANAEHDATYLLAKVEVVATYKLAGINRTRMEGLFHRLFASARLNITIHDRFGHPVQPEEWFLVPLFVIDEAVARIRDGSITGYRYEPGAAKLVKAQGEPRT